VGVPVLVTVFLLAVSVLPWTMRVAVSSKNNESHQVRRESQATDNQNELGVPNLGRVDESRKRFEDDGYAEGDEEDGVEEGTENLGAEPLRASVLVGISNAIGPWI
jgi:hypothetical protein